MLNEVKNPEKTIAQHVALAPVNRVFFNDRGLRAGWRILIFAILFRIVLLPLIFLAARPVRGRIESAVGDISEALLLICVLLATWIMARVERRSWLDYGLRDGLAPRHFLSGAVVGFVSLTVMLAAMRAAHAFYFGPQAMHGSALAVSAALALLGFVLVALLEETLFRGYAFYTLIDGIGFWPAAVVLSIIFAAAHVRNPGEAKVGIVAVFAFGMILAFSIWRTGSLLWAIGFHLLWDYSETFIYGVPDSGFVSPEHLLSAKLTGPAWITGGSVGPEGSWFIFLVLALIAFVIHFAYRG
jgi:membrane protease YdiL (CAAX protease family)